MSFFGKKSQNRVRRTQDQITEAWETSGATVEAHRRELQRLTQPSNVGPTTGASAPPNVPHAAPTFPGTQQRQPSRRDTGTDLPSYSQATQEPQSLYGAGPFPPQSSNPAPSAPPAVDSPPESLQDQQTRRSRPWGHFERLDISPHRPSSLQSQPPSSQPTSGYASTPAPFQPTGAQASYNEQQRRYAGSRGQSGPSSNNPPPAHFPQGRVSPLSNGGGGSESPRSDVSTLGGRFDTGGPYGTNTSSRR